MAPQARWAQPTASRPLKAAFPCFWGHTSTRRAKALEGRRTLSWCSPTHTHLMTQVLLRMAPEDPLRTTVFSAFSKSSVRTQQRFQNRTVSLQSLCFSTWYNTRAVQPPPAREWIFHITVPRSLSNGRVKQLWPRCSPRGAQSTANPIKGP